MKHLSLLFTTLFLQCTIIFAQSTVLAPAPAPPGPLNVSKILEKAGQFTTFIHLLQNTQEFDQITQQLNYSNTGLTIFAPTDNAFSNLIPGMLNSLSDQQKVQLIQFHILPTRLSMTQFQTASNPLRTQAGDSQNGEFPLNVTTTGNQVNITTGVVNTTVSNTIFTDGKIAVYQVDSVLLPLDFFRSPSPSPAPAPAAVGKSDEEGDDKDGAEPGADRKADSSGATKLGSIWFGVLVFYVFCVLL